MPKLTKRVVDKLKPNTNGKDLFVWDTGDGSLKGFGVRVKASGVASYLVQYRNKEGRTRRMAIGKINVLTPEEARKSAMDKLKCVSDGGDPSAERHAARGTMTVDELCDLYLAEAKNHIKPSTLKADKSRIANHVKPLLGRRAVNGLTLEDIEKFQNHVAAGKTRQSKRQKGRGAHATGGRSAASRCIGMLGGILEFAKRRRIITENPARGVQKFPDQKRRRFLSLDEITVLGNAMRETAETENAMGIAALRALLLTGCRRNEILSLPPEWLDAKARCIRFGDTKTGAQLRPIGAAAAKFLEARKSDKDWIFPADRGDGHFVGLRRVLQRLCKKAEIKGVGIHTLRHTFAATAAELGFSELTIAGLLGHTVPGVTARYAHVPDRALVSAADIVSTRIAAALDGIADNAEVIPIRKAK